MVPFTAQVDPYGIYGLDEFDLLEIELAPSDKGNRRSVASLRMTAGEGVNPG